MAAVRPCVACNHSPYWHRLDDSLNLDPTDPATPFRCTGVDFDGCGIDCANYVDPDRQP